MEAFARNHQIPIEWAEKGVRKQDSLRPALRRLEKQGQCGIYFILKNMKQGSTFHSTVPKYPTADPHYRLLAKQRSRFTHYLLLPAGPSPGSDGYARGLLPPLSDHYYLNGHSFLQPELNHQGLRLRQHANAFLAVADPEAIQQAADRFSPSVLREGLEYWILVLGPKFSRRERAAMDLCRLYAVAQVEYCRNFILKRHFPTHKICERSCGLGVWCWAADSHVFGTRVTRRLPQTHATLEKIGHGHHNLSSALLECRVPKY